MTASRTRERGYLTEPYKVVSLVDPDSGYTRGSLDREAARHARPPLDPRQLGLPLHERRAVRVVPLVRGRLGRALAHDRPALPPRARRRGVPAAARALLHAGRGALLPLRAPAGRAGARVRLERFPPRAAADPDAGRHLRLPPAGRASGRADRTRRSTWSSGARATPATRSACSATTTCSRPRASARSSSATASASDAMGAGTAAGRRREAGERRLEWAGDHHVGRFTAMAGPCEVLVDGDDPAVAATALEIARGRGAAGRGEVQPLSRRRRRAAHQRLARGSRSRWTTRRRCCSTTPRAATSSRRGASTSPRASCGARGRSTAPRACPARPTCARCSSAWAGIASRWRRPWLTLPHGMEVDFGGIGKEYAVDRAVSLVAARRAVRLPGQLRRRPRRERPAPRRPAVGSRRGRPRTNRAPRR